MSVDTLNTDLATLRVPPGHAPACECRRCEEHAAALARVEAELSRLREALAERPTLEEAVANVNYWKDEATRLREESESNLTAFMDERDKAVAAEARCARLQEELDETGECRMLCTPEAQAKIARLQQALRWMADYKMTGSEQTLHIDFQGKAREALAEPDTPADDWHALSPLDGEDTPADSQEPPAWETLHDGVLDLIDRKRADSQHEDPS